MDLVIENILDIIGNTPMLSLKKLTGLNIFAKAEYLNPGGSIKDRVAKYMIEQAESRGLLKPGMTIMEPTSGQHRHRHSAGRCTERVQGSDRDARKHER